MKIPYTNTFNIIYRLLLKFNSVGWLILDRDCCFCVKILMVPKQCLAVCHAAVFGIDILLEKYDFTQLLWQIDVSNFVQKFLKTIYFLFNFTFH